MAWRPLDLLVSGCYSGSAKPQAAPCGHRRKVRESNPRADLGRPAAFEAVSRANREYLPIRRMAQESNLWAVSPRSAAFKAVPHANCGCHPVMAEARGIEPLSRVSTTCRLPSGSARQLRLASSGGVCRNCTYARVSPCTP